MLRLYFDYKNHLYKNKDLTKCVALIHVTFVKDHEIFDKSEDLERRILRFAEKKFAKDRRKPDAYFIKEITNFCVVEFIYITAPYIDLSKKVEEAAK